MQTIKMDFQSQSTPPVVPVMQSDSQSRFIGLTLYDGGVPYSAPSGAVYTVEYHGQGANNIGWYDTIQLSSGTRRKAVVVSSSSPNVVTIELAEQALRVNGEVKISLCVLNNTGYKLNTFPIICRVTGAPYVDPVSVRSYFYVTGLTSDQWMAYVTACQDAQKRAEDAAAKFVTDPTLSLSGKAADAAKVGEAINAESERAKGVESQIKEDIGDLTSDNGIKSNMIDGQNSYYQVALVLYEKKENKVLNNFGGQTSVVECDNTQLINLEKYPSTIKVFNIYQGVNWGAVVGKKKDGTSAGWKYSSLPSSFCTKYDNYVEINIDYLRSSDLWESLGFNMPHGSDLRMEYDTEILSDKKKLEWLIIPHRFIVDKNGHGDYVTIQDAVNNANNGDEIIVFEGEYEEAVDLGTKALHLHGLNANNTIIWNDTGAYDTPPLEVGHGLIENLTFCSKKDPNKDYSEITRKSYAVHLDQRWGTGDKSVVFKNCVFIGEHTTPIGCGVVDDVNIELYDCLADATTLNNGNAFQIHGDGEGTGNANITISNCTFKKGNTGNGNGILLSNGGASYNTGTTITIKANNCYGSFYNNVGDLLILDSSSFGNSDKGLNSV